MAAKKKNKKEAEGKTEVTKVDDLAKDALTSQIPTSKNDIIKMIVSAVIGAVVGAVIGHFVGPLISGMNPMSGRTTINETELESPVATYTYNGQRIQISAREVLENTASLDTLVNEDGTFPIPSADDVLSYARNAILNKAVEDEGITVTDEEVTEYAMQYLQTDDFEVIASNWGITVEDAESIVRESCAVYKLHDQIVGEVEVAMPEAPATCEEGKEEEPNADYGAYVVSLLGDEWDAENNTWARTDGPYYESMSTMEFSADSATYVQAETAYFVAYTQYTQAYANSQQLWTDYVNGLLGNASIEIYSLVS